MDGKPEFEEYAELTNILAKVQHGPGDLHLGVDRLIAYELERSDKIRRVTDQVRDTRLGSTRCQDVSTARAG